METCVASTITTHLAAHELSHNHQWAYKEGHSTDLLLVKMTEDWRRVLDNNLVVGVVFVDFRKAFNSISHPVLLRKLQELGRISGDLWSWIKNYLSNRHQVTVINGCVSKLMPVKFGVPQGSVLGPILFYLFCNNLLDIDDSEGDIYMYADDTTLYAIAPTPDLAGVAEILNRILSKLYLWCLQNRLTPHFIINKTPARR